MEPARERPCLVVVLTKVYAVFGPRVSHFLKVRTPLGLSCSFWCMSTMKRGGCVFCLIHFPLYRVGPHYPVKREGGLEQTRVYGHAVVYANTDRADGRVEAILPELGVFGKRPKSTGQYHHS